MRYRLATMLALAALGLVLNNPMAAAHPSSVAANKALEALWTSVLTTPSDRNPFGTGGDAYECIDLGRRLLAPFGPDGVESCSTTTDVTVFVVGSSYECSTFEGNGPGEAALRACARRSDAQVAPNVTLDGRPQQVAEAETALMHLTLPVDNIFGPSVARKGLSVAHGWVTFLEPLRVGTHSITISATGSDPITTTIEVRSDCH